MPGSRGEGGRHAMRSETDRGKEKRQQGMKEEDVRVMAVRMLVVRQVEGQRVSEAENQIRQKTKDGERREVRKNRAAA
eukprot:753948-Hanusia_phi.AAC.1